MRWLVATTALSAALISGCASTSKGGGAFPTPAELDQLAAAQPAEHGLGGAEARPARWDFVVPGGGATDLALAAHPRAHAFDDLLLQAVAANPGGATASADMQCVARELASFWLTHRGSPPRGLQLTIMARCGSTAYMVRHQAVSGDVPADRDAAAVAAAWRAQVQAALASLLRGEHVVAGLWFERREGRAVVMMASGPRRVRLAAASLTPGADGRVRLAGELLRPAATMSAAVTMGAYDVGICRADLEGGVRFHIDCPVRATDDQSWLEVSALQEGRIIGPVALRALLRPSQAPMSAWRRPAPAQAASGGAKLAGPVAEFAGIVNATRAAAGRGPVAVSDVESRRAERLARTYFQATAGFGDPTLADRVALGVMAGWGLGGEVARGHFAEARADADQGPAGLAAAMLERPAGRMALLSEQVGTIAVGPLIVPGAPAAGVIVAGYEPLSGVSPAEGRRRVMEKLQAARKAAGAAPARPLGAEFDAMADEAARSVEAGQSMQSGLEGLMFQAAGVVVGGRVRGLWITVADLAQLEFPEEVVRMPSLQLAVAVGAHRAEGHPWAMHAVYVVFVEPDAGTFAWAPYPLCSARDLSHRDALGAGRTCRLHRRTRRAGRPGPGGRG